MRNQRILTLMASVTAALVLIAVLMRGGLDIQPGGEGSFTGTGGTNSGGSAGTGAAGGKATDLLVDLTSMADRITAVEVQSTNDTTRIERRDGTWVVASRDGFPAQTESVVGVLRGLSNLRKSQKLTAKPERHADLGLAWPDTTNESKLVSIYAGGETPVAQVVVGRGVFQPDGVYARLLSEPQTWRCTGTLNVAATPQTWIVNPVADVAAESIKTISGCDTTGRTITLTRDDKGMWALAPADGAGADAASGAGAPTDSVAEGFKSAIPSLVVGMQAEEVRRATPEDATRPNTVTVTYGIGDNANVHARLWRDGETYFVMLDAALPEPAAPAAATTDGAVEKSSDESSTKAPEDPFARVRTLSATWNGWVFTVPSWRASQLGRLFGDPAPAAPSAPGMPGAPMMTMPGGSSPPMLLPPTAAAP
jgi:hypothetical protein